MADVFSIADEFGPLKVIHVHDPAIDLKGILVVDNIAKGPALGGVRMAPDVTFQECFRLARAMTWKNAAADLPFGGGKVVVHGDPRMPREKKATLLRAFASALRKDEDYIFAPDMGTDEECMAWIRDEIGRVVGLPRLLGGIPLDEIGATGWGLRHACEIALKAQGRTLEGTTFAVQGFGAVGKNAARFLSEKGAVLVAVADIDGMIRDPDGLDVDRLIALKEEGKNVTSYEGGEKLPRDEIIAQKCDLWIPAARPDVINETNVHLMNAGMIVEGANIPATERSEEILHEKGVVVLPDFIANAGGVICAAMDYRGSSESAVYDSIAEKIRRNTEEVLRVSREKGITPRAAGMEIARERVIKAMSYRRYSIFSTAPGFT